MSELLPRDRRVVWHPYTQHGIEDDPLPVVAARASTLVLDDGREVLDAISSWWTCLHGHGRPEIAAAIRAQAERLDHVLFAGATHPPAVDLAEKLVALAPRGLTRVFYSDDGSTAVEVALKIALQAHAQRNEHDRRVFVALEHGYHGDTFGAMAVGDPDPFFARFEKLLFRVARVAADERALAACVADLGRVCAGVIVEPLVQGAGGMRMHDPEFLAAARAACTRFGIPLIVDEVMTGFGRTGTMFACERAGIAPDLLCVAKGLTGGVLPLAATLATEELFGAFLSIDRGRALFHGHSFTANPVGCAAALASLEIAAREKTPTRLDAIGRAIEDELRHALPDPTTLALRRTGGIVAFDLPARTSGYLGTDPHALRRAAIERGVLLRPLGNVVYAMPPACTTSDECRTIARAMAALVEVAR